MPKPATSPVKRPALAGVRLSPNRERIEREAAAQYREFVERTDRAKETDVERSYLR
jgi:hypothetical protein